MNLLYVYRLRTTTPSSYQGVFEKPEILKLVLLKETEKMVTVDDPRSSRGVTKERKVASYHRYFHTFEEAKQYILSRYARKIKEFEESAKFYRDAAVVAEVMTEEDCKDGRGTFW